MGRKKPLPDDGPAGPFNAAFKGLEALRAQLPSADAPPAEPPAPATSRAPEASPRSAPFAPKVVLQRERKGHGGKTVTRIRGLEGDADAQAKLAQSLARKLGVGAKVEGDEIWVQGDQVARLLEILPGLGARKVVAGN